MVRSSLVARVGCPCVVVRGRSVVVWSRGVVLTVPIVYLYTSVRILRAGMHIRAMMISIRAVVSLWRLMGLMGRMRWLMSHMLVVSWMRTLSVHRMTRMWHDRLGTDWVWRVPEGRTSTGMWRRRAVCSIWTAVAHSSVRPTHRLPSLPLHRRPRFHYMRIVVLAAMEDAIPVLASVVGWKVTLRLLVIFTLPSLAFHPRSSPTYLHLSMAQLASI